MAHYVICPVCKQKFNRDKIECVIFSEKPKRYAHPECLKEHQQQQTQEERDANELISYIKLLFNEPYINAKINKQINDFKKNYGYSYSGMLKSLIYWFEIKGNSIEKANGGIGIIPYIYQQAHDYYYALYLTKLANENKDIQEYRPKTKYIEIFAPVNEPKKVKLFNLEDKE